MVKFKANSFRTGALYVAHFCLNLLYVELHTRTTSLFRSAIGKKHEQKFNSNNIIVYLANPCIDDYSSPCSGLDIDGTIMKMI